MHDFEEENISIGPLFMTVGVGTLFVIAVIFALTGLQKTMKQSLEAEWAGAAVLDVETNSAEQAERLGTYGMINKDKGQFRIPVDQAMKLVLEERGEG
jgi:hypothetical protein